MSEDIRWKDGKVLNPEFFIKSDDGGLKLRGARCSACGKVYFPFKEVCNLCFEKSNSEIPLKGRGRLVSWSVARQVSLLGIKVPYCFGYIDLEEGARIYGLIKVRDKNFELLKKGMELEMTIGFLNQNMTEENIYTYKFQPLAGETEGGERECEKLQLWVSA